MPASRPAWMAAITSRCELLAPQWSPPASHEPNPTTEISGPSIPSRRVSIALNIPARGDRQSQLRAGAGPVRQAQQVALGEPLEAERPKVDTRLAAGDHGGGRLGDGRRQLEAVAAEARHHEHAVAHPAPHRGPVGGDA